MAETRTASDVLLSIEKDIKAILKAQASNDFNIKILSNKLNKLILKLDAIEKEPKPKPASPIFAEAVDTSSKVIKNSKVSSPESVFVDTNDNVEIADPQNSHRRTSRHQTYTGSNSYKIKEVPQQPIQVPSGSGTQIVSPKQDDEFVIKDVTSTRTPARVRVENKDNDDFIAVNPEATVPVVQRVVDVNGKSIFMGSVKLLSLPDLNLVHKTRTTGSGKWTATIKPGKYRVIISKRDDLTKEFIDYTND